MKTVKALLKELLKGKKQEPDGENRSSDVSTIHQSGEDYEALSVNQQNFSTKNQEKDETETDEDPGVPELDNPDAGKIAGDNQGEEGTGEIKSITSTPPSPQSEGLGSMKSNIPETGEIESQEDNLIKEAFEKGRIAGRNEKIEESYFPTTDDGIPHFHGKPTQRNSSYGDIFSMAREA